MRSKKKAPDEDFQMAPMIDMVFLLLVFFMTVSTMARSARPSMSLPESKIAKIPKETPPRTILSVLSADTYAMGPATATLEEIGLNLKQEDPSAVSILIRASPETPYAEIEPLLDLVRSSGHSKLQYACWEVQ